MQVLHHALIVMHDRPSLFRQSHHATSFSKTTETFSRANEAAWEGASSDTLSPYVEPY
jgi:hypothetical protein